MRLHLSPSAQDPSNVLEESVLYPASYRQFLCIKHVSAIVLFVCPIHLSRESFQLPSLESDPSLWLVLPALLCTALVMISHQRLIIPSAKSVSLP